MGSKKTYTIKEIKKAPSIKIFDKEKQQYRPILYPNGIKVDLEGSEFRQGIELTPGAAPTDTSDRLYNENGSLKFAGTTVGGAGAGGAPIDPQYVTLAADGTLTNERVLTAGSNITITDAGAGGAVTIASTASGGGAPDIGWSGTAGVISTTGSLGIGETTPGYNLHIKSATDAAIYLEADTNNSPEDDNAFIKMSQDNSAVTGYVGFCGNTGKDPENTAYTGAIANSLLIGTKDIYSDIQIGTNNTVRLSIDSAGESTFEKVTNFNSGLSGSLSQLTDGSSYLVAGNRVNITTGSNGQVTVASKARHTINLDGKFYFGTANVLYGHPLAPDDANLTSWSQSLTSHIGSYTAGDTTFNMKPLHAFHYASVGIAPYDMELVSANFACVIQYWNPVDNQASFEVWKGEFTNGQAYDTTSEFTRIGLIEPQNQMAHSTFYSTSTTFSTDNTVSAGDIILFTARCTGTSNGGYPEFHANLVFNET